MVLNYTTISDFFAPLMGNVIFWLILAIATIVGGIAAIGYFIEKWQQRKYRPALTFNIGMLYSNETIENEFKRETISTLIYGANAPQNSDVMFYCPYLLMNNSKLPINNIILQLEYMSKHAVKNEDKIISENQVIKNEGKIIETYKEIFGFSEKDHHIRDVQIFDSIVQVRYTIPVLRPGEKTVVGDPIKFSNVLHDEVPKDGEDSLNEKLIKKLKEIKKLKDLCVVDAFVYSENCPPLSTRIKLFWFDSNSPKELKSLIHDVVMAFWGKIPKPGRYLYLGPLSLRKKKQIFIKEYGEVVVPKLEKFKTSKNKYFCWERNPLKSLRQIIIFEMPPWNYYQLSAEFETADLIEASGFIGPISLSQIYREFITKARLWKYFNGLKK